LPRQTPTFVYRKMRISASIYANRKDDIITVAKELEANRVDMLHIDCNDDPSVFADINCLKAYTSLPLDLHLITADPSVYVSQLDELPVEFLTIQLENLSENAILPKTGFNKLGLALISNTPIDAFGPYSNQCDFVLLMATEPGKSGGAFNKQNFKRIREFKRKFPSKRIHVDGGVNAEVSFILRNLGVYAAVSGSYLFRGKTVGGALHDLKNAETDSHYRVADFMRETDETPIVEQKDLNLKNVLGSIEMAKMGFTTVIGEGGKLNGIISNADVRKGLLKNIGNLDNLEPEELINRDPITVNEELTVTQLLKLIRQQSIPINFLPVTNSEGILMGSLTFNDLIKGEA